MIGVGLAFRQLWRAPIRALLAMLLLVATLTPLLLVASLKSGQVDPLIAGVRANPDNLEIALLNDRELTPAQLAAIRALPGLGYFEPTTRSLSLRAHLGKPSVSGREAVGLLPSSAGDPLLAGGDAPRLDEVVLSDGAMRSLKLEPADKVVLTSSRFDNSPILAVPLTVVAALPPARLAGSKALVHPQLAFELESYLDGFAVPRLGATGKDAGGALPAPANARLYADRLESVLSLAEALESAGFFARVSNSGVELALSLDSAARVLVVTIGGALSVGAAMALWMGLALCFLPQKRHVALLRLMGAGPGLVLAYIMTLGISIALLGLAAALASFLVLSGWLNANVSVVGAPGTALSFLSSQNLAGFAVAGLLLAGIVSLAFARIFGSIQPSGALRDELS